MIKVFQLDKEQSEEIYDKITFPCGEISIKLNEKYSRTMHHIVWAFENISEIFEMLLLIDTINCNGGDVYRLSIPYMPFSREDRRELDGSFSLRLFATILNAMKIREVVTVDPHSDVTPALFHYLRVIEQHTLFVKHFEGKKDFHLIAPDAGALKKIYKLAQLVDCISVVECSKKTECQNWRNNRDDGSYR